MADIPQTKFNSPWTVANIEAELNGVKSARGNLSMTEKLEQKQDVLTFDDVPTDSSSNPVKSGGVYTALSGKMSPSDWFGVGATITSTAQSPYDLDDLTAVGVYNCGATAAATLLHCPVSTGFRLEVLQVAFTTRRQQRLYPQAASNDSFYIRTEGNSGYGSWYKFTGTIVPDPQS